MRAYEKVQIVRMAYDEKEDPCIVFGFSKRIKDLELDYGIVINYRCLVKTETVDLIVLLIFNNKIEGCREEAGLKLLDGMVIEGLDA